jgi:putative transposase
MRRRDMPMRDQGLSDAMIAKLWGEFNSLFHEEVKQATQEALKELLRDSLDGELARIVGCERYERSENRTAYRNGSYPRTLGTTVGQIAFRMPRADGVIWDKKVLRNYQRRTDDFDMAVMACFVMGSSTRKSAFIGKLFSGTKISAGTVSNIHKRVDAVLARYRKRKLEDRYQFLILDGLSVPVRMVRNRRRMVLLAVGVTKDFHLEVVGFMAAPSESELYWRSLLEDLAKRGLVGDSLAMIAHDGAGGIKAAVAGVYPYAQTQLCVFHTLKNVDERIKRRKNREELMGDASHVYDAETLGELERRARSFRKKWESREPNAVRTLFRHLEASTRYFQLPREQWHIIRTTNRVERLIGEIRRRIRPMGSFTNIRSCERIIFSLTAVLAPMQEDMPSSPENESQQTS